MMKLRSYKKYLPVAGGLFLTAAAVFYELLLHLWIGGSFAPGRFLPLILFAAVIGGTLGTLISLLPSATNGRSSALPLFWSSI